MITTFLLPTILTPKKVVATPLFLSAEVGKAANNQVVVQFSKPVKSPGNDFTAGVTIKVAGSGATITGATISTNRRSVRYTVDTAVTEGQTISWAYASASGDIEDYESTPNTLADVGETSGTNNIDTTAPGYSSGAIIDGTTIEITFDEEIESTDYTAGVSVKEDLGPKPISSAARQTDKAKVRYILTANIIEESSITWEYASASGNYKDVGGLPTKNNMGNISAQTITNNLNYATPTLLSVEIGAIADNILVATFSEDIVSPSLGYDAGVTIQINGTPDTIVSATRQTNQSIVRYTTTTSVVNTDFVTFNYYAADGDLKDQHATNPKTVPNASMNVVTNNLNTDILQFSSGEVGLVDDTTIEVTFSKTVNSPLLGYDAGVTFRADAVDLTISSAARQTDETKVRYLMTAPIMEDAVVDFSYNPEDGDIEDQHATNPTPLDEALLLSVTNNVNAAAPTITSVEIGLVADNVVRMRFSEDVNSPALGYDSGVVIDVDSVPATISSAIRQTNQGVVHYTLSASVTSGQIVTFSYTPGDIEDQHASNPLAFASVTDRAVTNNVPDPGEPVVGGYLFNEEENSHWIFYM